MEDFFKYIKTDKESVFIIFKILVFALQNDSITIYYNTVLRIKAP